MRSKAARARSTRAPRAPVEGCSCSRNRRATCCGRSSATRVAGACTGRTCPPLDFVIGNTGISAATGPLVANVKERVGHDRKAAEAVREIGRITLDGLDALRRNDLAAAGRLMDRNHALLTALGVGHPMLDRLVQAARRTSYGAKLTGAGGGGSIVALSDRPAETVEAIRAAGGKAFVVRSDPIGVATLS